MSALPQEKLTLAMLPHDILKVILEYSHDAESLLSTIVSCRAFYEAFNTTPSSVMKAFVSRQIGAAVLPEAIQTLKAASFRCHGVSDLSDWELPPTAYRLFSDGRNALLNYQWNLSGGVAAVRFHSLVDDFAQRFASESLFWLQNNSDCEEDKYEEVWYDEVDPPSSQERARIQRALYRFETYCSLFPPRNGVASPNFDAQFPVFSSLSVLEREQLASIYEYLWRDTIPDFNEVALHNITWGNFNVSLAREFLHDKHVEWIISRGLRFIYNFYHAETDSQRLQLYCCDKPGTAHHFLGAAFSHYKSHQVLEARAAASKKISKQPSMPFYNDPDPGPERIWRRSHEPFWPLTTDFAQEEEYTSERHCGFVFWDERRLTSTGWLNKDWARDEIIVDEWELVYEETPSWEEEEESWNARSALFQKGILGYWDWDMDFDLTIRKE
ncbi:hypothetical protein F4819DRAFT_488607 [Hypoxylon fuscum]|nr:hypothetical protein F4819DRAFT_488607 [Hypoxylon fuscum]